MTIAQLNGWLGIDPGRLRHSIQIQVPTETQDEHGQPIPTWSSIATVRASVEPISGRELFSAKQIHADITHKITLRYVSGITPKYRILFGSRAFDILAVQNIQERNLLLEIMAVERLYTTL